MATTFTTRYSTPTHNTRQSGNILSGVGSLSTRSSSTSTVHANPGDIITAERAQKFFSDLNKEVQARNSILGSQVSLSTVQSAYKGELVYAKPYEQARLYLQDWTANHNSTIFSNIANGTYNLLLMTSSGAYTLGKRVFSTSSMSNGSTSYRDKVYSGSSSYNGSYTYNGSTASLTMTFSYSTGGSK